MTTLSSIMSSPSSADKEENMRIDDAEWLCDSAAWLEETRQGDVVESFVDSERGWTGWQVWGFGTVDGERWLCRRFVIRRKDREEGVRIVLRLEWVGDI
jgi:hypothetical protein